MDDPKIKLPPDWKFPTETVKEKKRSADICRDSVFWENLLKHRK